VQVKTAFLVYRSHLETDQLRLPRGRAAQRERRVEGGPATIVFDANALLDKNLSVFL